LPNYNNSGIFRKDLDFKDYRVGVLRLNLRYRKTKEKRFSRKNNNVVNSVIRNIKYIVANPGRKETEKSFGCVRFRGCSKIFGICFLDFSKIKRINTYQLDLFPIVFFNPYFVYLNKFINLRKRSFLYFIFSHIALDENYVQKIVFDFNWKILHIKDQQLGINPMFIIYYTTFRLWRWKGEIEEYKRFYYPCISEKGNTFIDHNIDFYYDQEEFFCT